MGNLGLTAPFFGYGRSSQFAIVYLMVDMPYTEEICSSCGLYKIYCIIKNNSEIPAIKVSTHLRASWFNLYTTGS